MVGLFDHCLFGRGGAAPSIDTAMHALVGCQHVDHLHPDAIIALRHGRRWPGADAPVLRRRGAVGRLAAARASSSASTCRSCRPPTREAIGCVLGGHGLTTWGDTSEECERRSLDVIRRARGVHRRARPAGAVRRRGAGLGAAAAAAPASERAAELAPILRGIASTDAPMVGHYNDERRRPATSWRGTRCRAWRRSARRAPTTSCARRWRRWSLDLPADAELPAIVERLGELHAAYREEYAAYYERHAEPDSPAMRGSDPAIVLVPGVGMFSYGKDKQTARVAGEFYVNAINVMRGAESLSEYRPISEREKFRIEYWSLEEAKLRRLPKPKPLATRIALVTGAGSGIGRAIALRLAAEGACVVVADLDAGSAAEVAAEIGGPDRAVAVPMDVSSAEQVAAAFKAASLAFGGVDLVVNNAGLSISKPLLETTEHDWDLQHDVMAKGSFLVSREAARIMMEQGLGGDIVYIASKNGVFAGPSNIAYGAAKADQAHQVRLLAAELGEFGIRVNGVNPDGVVRGSGIFSKGWGAQRAAVYGVAEEDLGAFYAQRTLLGREVLPEHVAAGVFALVGGDLSLTTGLHIPVDAGVAAAFLR